MKGIFRWKRLRLKPEISGDGTRFPVLGIAIIALVVPNPVHHSSIPGTGTHTLAVDAQNATVPTARPVSPPLPPIRGTVVDGVVRPGDTISALLGDYLSPKQIHALARESRDVFPLSRICAGKCYELRTVGGAFESFVYDIDREERLIIRSGGGKFDVFRVPIPYTIETAMVKGTVESSLFEAVVEIGETPELALALAEIFAWDIDFILDIREGDSFQALVEKRYRNGEPAGYGEILAAEFINQDNAYRAIRFQDGERPPAYYDPSGKSLRKNFLKAPLSFTRISSGYTRKRFHPIKKTWRAHLAVDYAAPVGTPIKAVGEGTVVERGYTRGNGKYVKIRHNSTYETLYLHMSRFARGMKRGKRVSQGQVIGYVGSSGLATGPHLCFRMRKNGAPVNPLKVKAVPVNPVSPEHMADFQDLAAQLLSRFDGVVAKPAQFSKASPALLR